MPWTGACEVQIIPRPPPTSRTHLPPLTAALVGTIAVKHPKPGNTDPAAGTLTGRAGDPLRACKRSETNAQRRCLLAPSEIMTTVQRTQPPSTVLALPSSRPVAIGKSSFTWGTERLLWDSQ